MAYSSSKDPLRVPRTPLESRQGYHPKGEDQLVWKSPPTRQLSRQRRVQYESDIRERFYDDYIGERSMGDAKNEVMTTSELAKMKFDPSVYRVNAYQGLVYDPMRTVPAGVDLHGKLQVEKERERERQVQQHRQRRMSDSALHMSRPTYSRGQQRLEPIQPRTQLTGYPGATSERPRSAMKKEFDATLAPDLVPGVEDWFATANPKDQEVAANFFRTLSSHGKRPDPAARAALHRSRVKSAVMTPTRKIREDRATQDAFQQLARETVGADQAYSGKKPAREQLKRRRSLTENPKNPTKGSMFTAKAHQQPSHFTVHPDWASESLGHTKKK